MFQSTITILSDSHEKCIYVMISVRPAGRLPICGKNFNIAIFSDTIDMIKVKLCVMVVLISLIELYSFIPLCDLIVFQGHINIKQF